MKSDSKREFITNNTISKEDFMDQFEDASMEIIVQIRYGWQKGQSHFQSLARSRWQALAILFRGLTIPRERWECLERCCGFARKAFSAIRISRSLRWIRYTVSESGRVVSQTAPNSDTFFWRKFLKKKVSVTELMTE